MYKYDQYPDIYSRLRKYSNNMKHGVWGKFAQPQRKKDGREKNIDAVLDNLFTNRFEYSTSSLSEDVTPDILIKDVHTDSLKDAFHQVRRNYKNAISENTSSPPSVSSPGSDKKNLPNTSSSRVHKKRQSEDSILDVYKGKKQPELKNQWSHSSGRKFIRAASLD